MEKNLIDRFFTAPIKMEDEIPHLYKRYHFIYLMIAVFHPLWGVLLNFLLPQFNDPLAYRLIGAAMALISDYVTRKYNLSYGKRYFIIMFNLICLNTHLLWVTGVTGNNPMYVLGSYLTYIGTGMLFDDEKTLLVFVSSMTLPLIIFNGTVANSTFPVIFIYFLFLSGGIINYLGLKDRFQLITKLRYLNDEIKQKSKELDQERINTFNASKLASLGDMAGGIAHEMNNPLAIIQGFARKLKRSIVDNREGSADESVKSLEKIVETTNRMALIIEKLKKFSRDGTNDEMTVVSPSELVDSVVQFFDERFKTDLIECKKNIDYDSLKNAGIFCREVEISQVLINLINNAIHAAKENSNTPPVVNIASRSDADYIYFSVSDSGPGIPKEIEAKIFEPFFTTKQEIKATGLGLSISRTVVEEYQGQIYLDHESSETRFTVKLKKTRLSAAS
jgi:signal transduction histidine kinase